MNNETMQLLYNRKSVRAYEKQPIPEADVQAILRAAVEAPTAGNMTLWSAIRVTDEAKKKRLSETCDNQPFIATAPLVLVFCADYKRWYDLFASLELGETLRRPGEGDMMLAMVDAVIAAHASVVAADALGYGSCYIGDIVENYEAHRELFDLPDWAFPIGMLCLGYYRENHLKKLRDRFDKQYIVFDEKYKHLTEEEYRQMFAQEEKRYHPDNPYRADNFAQAFYARKTGAAFSKEMARSVRVAMKQWDGRLLNAKVSNKKDS